MDAPSTTAPLGRPSGPRALALSGASRAVPIATGTEEPPWKSASAPSARVSAAPATAVPRVGGAANDRAPSTTLVRSELCGSQGNGPQDGC